MKADYLDFEHPIVELEEKIEALRYTVVDSDVNIGDEIARLQDKSQALIKKIFSNLSAWQITQLARHPMRPHTLDYIQNMCQDFQELHGDRCYADDKAIITGIGYLDRRPVAVIGHQKGRTVNEKLKHNFGMSRPEGYRKALRIMQLAEKFNLPIISLIDTPGAYPGVGAEERNQSEAIARNLLKMPGLRVPIICVVIGEGGSGGALGIGVGDQILMMEYSTYSVISPEGCASILWRDSGDKAAEAAEAMHITAQRLKDLNLIDQIVYEPLGGAHRNIPEACELLKATLIDKLEKLQALPLDELLATRHQKIASFGQVAQS